MKKNYFHFLVLFFFLKAITVNAQLAGTFSVPATYSTVAAAVADLNLQGVNGPVTILVDAGHTETVAVGGITMTASGTSANPIVFQKNGVGANPLLVAYSGGTATPASAIQDGVWSFIGSDYITVNGIDIFDPNTSNPSTMEYGIGFFKASGTDGCQNNTIKNCRISLSTVNNAFGSGPAADGSRGINQVNSLITSQTTNVTVSSAAGAHSNNIYQNNTIENCNTGVALMGYAAFSPYTNADQNNLVGGSPSTGNSIINFGGGGTVTAAVGLRTINQYNLGITHNTINSNTGAGVNHAQIIRGMLLGSSTSANVSVLNNTVTIHGGGTTNLITAIENQSGSTAANNTVTINSNLITNCTYTTSTSGGFYGIFNSASPAYLSVSSNTFTGNSTNAASGAYYNIYNSGAPTINNSISNNLVSGITFSATSTSLTNYNIYNGSAGMSSTVTIANNNIENINYAGTTGGTGTWGGVVSFGTSSVQTIQNNTFTNLSLKTTGTIYFMYQSNYSTTFNVNNNSIVGTFSRVSTSGTGALYGIYNGAFTTLGTTANVFNNNFSNISNGSNSGAMYMLYWTSHQTMNVYNNVFDNISAPAATSTFYGLYPYYYSANANIYNNTLSNVTYGSTGGTIYGMYFYEYNGVSANVYNNTFYNLKNGGTTNIGMYIYYTGSTGTGSFNFHRNRISDIGSSTTFGGNISGINIFSALGGNVNVYNNLIANISATATSNSNAVAGINVSSTVNSLNANLSYNSIHLSGSSSGTTFGSSGILANTAPNLTMRNNIVVNNMTPVGTGLTAAYRRSSATLNTYSPVSNNNLFYAGTPGASNVIFTDGTNTYQTLAAYQAAMVNRDGASVTENPPFISTVGTNSDFLKITSGVPTQVEGWAVPVAGITTDYTLTPRSPSTPDIGAWEGNYLSSIPACSGTPATNTAIVSSSSVCPNSLFSLSLANSYTTSGMTYQWQASTTGSVGPYSNISGATGSVYSTSVTANTWYQVIITCSNGGGSVTSTPVGVTVSGDPCNCLTYCTSNATSTSDEELFNVTIGSLNNTSTCSQTGGPGSLMNQYSNYTGMIAPPFLATSNSYVLSVTAGQCNTGSYSGIIGAYIDYNQNGSFTDPGELVYTSPYGNIPIAGITHTGNVTIPAGATPGITRMRVVVVESSVVNPCGTYSWGETEDYCVMIGAPVSCAGAPGPNTVTASSTLACSGSMVSLGLSTTYTTSGLAYQWSTSTSSVGPWTPVANATLSALSTTVSGNVWYQAVITCTNGGASTTATPVYVSTFNDPCVCASYCSSSATSTSDEEIFNVSVGTLNNTSTCGQTGGPGSVQNMYSNYTSVLAAPSLTLGNTYTLSITAGQCNTGAYNAITAAYIDYNQNGSFTDPGETVFTSTYGIVPVAGITFTSPVTIPANAIPGNTRMRVVLVESSVVNPCNSFTWGETEDYCVYLDPGPPCTGANGGTLANATLGACAGGTVSMLSNSVTLGQGTTYQWMFSTTPGGPYSNVSGGTGANVPAYTTGSLTAGTYYYVLQVACPSASAVAVSNEATVSIDPIPSATVSNNSPLCAGQTLNLTANTTGATNYYWSGPASFTSTVQNPVISNVPGNASGNYSLVASTPNCSASVVITPVTVNSTVLNINAPASICLGDTATLMAIGNYTTLLWSTGSTLNTTTLSPSSNTVITVTGTGTSNCVANASHTLTVNNPTITGFGTTVCTPTTVATLSVNAFGPVSWYATSTPTNPIGTGNTYTTTAASTTTFYAQAVSTSTSSLFTTLAAGNGQAGNMFDVVAISNIAVNGFDMHFSSLGTATVEVWYRPGTFVGFESSNAGWTMAHTTTVTSLGTGSLTTIPGSFTVNVPAGQTYGFYVTALAGGPQVNYTNGTTLGNVYVQNADAQIKEGKGGSYFGVTFTPRIFNGQMRYTKPGCTSPVIPVVLNVGNLTTVSASAASPTVCQGGSTALNASGAVTYTWSNGAQGSIIAVTPSVTTTYTVTGEDNGCTGTDSVQVFVNALPGVTLTAAATTVCVNGPTIALTGSPNGGAYTGTNVGPGAFIPGSTAGTYTPVYAYSDPVTGCSNSASVTIVVSPCTDIASKTNTLKGLSVYPNPTFGEFVVELANGLNKTIEITDLTGRVVGRIESSDDVIKVDINSIANGSYFVRVYSDKTFEVVKLVKH